MKKIKFIAIISFILISILWLSGCGYDSCGSNEKEEEITQICHVNMIELLNQQLKQHVQWMEKQFINVVNVKN